MHKNPTMCGHVSTAVASDTSPCVLGCSGDFVTPPLPPTQPWQEEQFPPLQFLLNHHHLMTGAAAAAAAAAEFDFSDDSAAVFGYSGVSGSGFCGGSSGCNSPSSLGSGGGGGGEQSVMQRSVSSNDGYFGNFALVAHGPTYDSGPVRRALSAGDLHRMMKKGEEEQQVGRRGESELWNESNAIIEGMNRRVRYTPQEKKERIERYRSKRLLRNFNKRIKYECRKTLADSRPRIRGRFARNDEMEDTKIMSELHLLQGSDQDADTSWSSFLDSFLP